MLKTPKTSPFKTAYSKWALWLLTLWVTSSCASFISGPRLTNLNQKMTTLIGAINKVSAGGVLKRSENNRSFYSHYHPPGGDPNRDARRSEKRAQSVIHLLNSRRPYTIVVQYNVEQRFNGEYQIVSMDQEQAEKLKQKLDEYLASRPDAPDLIDDFRPF